MSKVTSTIRAIESVESALADMKLSGSEDHSSRVVEQQPPQKPKSTDDIGGRIAADLRLIGTYTGEKVDGVVGLFQQSKKTMNADVERALLAAKGVADTANAILTLEDSMRAALDAIMSSRARLVFTEGE